MPPSRTVSTGLTTEICTSLYPCRHSLSSATVPASFCCRSQAEDDCWATHAVLGVLISSISKFNAFFVSFVLVSLQGAAAAASIARPSRTDGTECESAYTIAVPSSNPVNQNREKVHAK